ncbi:hypothetical protein GCM10022289_19140 [Pedobacter jeongneungensis]|uniref:Uncharacterized protein n=1 Tax=Pedobacter jeongneungensis TaxID=947309 RepID=A0ABP8BC58_9SPHI
MDTTDKILKEISTIKDILARISGSENLPKKERFTKLALEKTAKEFSKLLSEREEWLSDHDLRRYFKEVYFGAGEFIREEFAFSSYFKQGRSYYYNRTDIKALADELKKRKVDLKRLIQCRKWCEAFNYAQRAIELLGMRPKKFITVPEDEQIHL